MPGYPITGRFGAELHLFSIQFSIDMLHICTTRSGEMHSPALWRLGLLTELSDDTSSQSTKGIYVTLDTQIIIWRSIDLVIQIQHTAPISKV